MVFLSCSALDEIFKVFCRTWNSYGVFCVSVYIEALGLSFGCTESAHAWVSVVRALVIVLIPIASLKIFVTYSVLPATLP